MLTEKMKDTLISVAYGVRLYKDGFFCIDEPDKRLDIRSLNALARRKLISWSGSGGSTYQVHVYLTEAGDTIFKEMRK